MLHSTVGRQRSVAVLVCVTGRRNQVIVLMMLHHLAVRYSVFLLEFPDERTNRSAPKSEYSLFMLTQLREKVFRPSPDHLTAVPVSDSHMD